MSGPVQEKPQDLSLKGSKKVKHIPPPLDLKACNLEGPSDLRTPKSPGDLPRECLPLRKRPLADADPEINYKSPKSAGFGESGFRSAFSAVDIRFHHDNRHSTTAPSSPASAATTAVPQPSAASVSQSSMLSLSSSSTAALLSSAFTPFHLTAAHPQALVPPPPPPTAATCNEGVSVANVLQQAANASLAAAAAAAAAAASSSLTPKSPYSNNGGFPTPPTELASATYSWVSPTSLGSLFPSPYNHVGLPHSPSFSSTALLSPAPSHQSSTNSSREELPLHCSLSNDLDAKRRFVSAKSRTPSNFVSSVAAECSSPLPSSPLLSPIISHSWPTPVWQCFMAGSRVKFLLPNTNTPWQKAEELGWKDRVALKVDSHNPYKFAPNGLTVVKIEMVKTDTVDTPQSSAQNESPNREGVSTVATQSKLVLLRFSPHKSDSDPEIYAECSADHPFIVKDKGWASVRPRLTLEKLGIPCHTISVGDICLPPDHQDAVRTPDLCDRFRKFEFSPMSDDPGSPLVVCGGRPVSVTGLRHHMTAVAAVPSLVKTSHNLTSSPPLSPARKKEKDLEKPKRPMNGFMLFAKKYRLELIQQHPGKDNRAISVLLGEAWKNLPLSEREPYSQRAKVMAEEQKKIFPDCWKRKRTLASGAALHLTSANRLSNVSSDLVNKETSS